MLAKTGSFDIFLWILGIGYWVLGIHIYLHISMLCIHKYIYQYAKQSMDSGGLFRYGGTWSSLNII